MQGSRRRTACHGMVLMVAAAVASAVDAAPAPFPPPTAADRVPRTAVVLAPYRFDDLMWENDRTAHRIYGRALEAAEPPSSSGIDAWGKSVPWPFMDRQLRTGDQHSNHGEGVDFYSVHGTRGAGGLGIWHDNKLWTSRNYRSHRIMETGGQVARFEVDFAPWPVDVGRKVWESRRFALPMGSHFTRMVSTINSDRPDPLIVGIGISRNPTGPAKADIRIDKSGGRVIFWGPDHPQHGAMAVAVLVDPASLVDIREDADNILLLVKQMPGKPFVYYTGAAWSRGAHVHSSAEWQAVVMAEKPDFDPRR